MFDRAEVTESSRGSNRMLFGVLVGEVFREEDLRTFHARRFTHFVYRISERVMRVLSLVSHRIRLTQTTDRRR